MLRAQRISIMARGGGRGKGVLSGPSHVNPPTYTSKTIAINQICDFNNPGYKSISFSISSLINSLNKSSTDLLAISTVHAGPCGVSCDVVVKVVVIGGRSCVGDVGGCSCVVDLGGCSYVVNVGGCSYVVNVGGRSCVVGVAVWWV